ncbi:diguanylate cyclase domain-containing protein [Sphingorhabdus sp.]|uniref:diguanylate cyclase domain-containing protein n=1 Tax=Sphingorhabdus sp. TaxID=1902408 RepID=UPI00391CC991
MARFKSVNDTLGDAAGDALIIQVTNWLIAHVSAYRGHVARIGGDEFVLFIAGAVPEKLK